MRSLETLEKTGTPLKEYFKEPMFLFYFSAILSYLSSYSETRLYESIKLWNSFNICMYYVALKLVLFVVNQLKSWNELISSWCHDEPAKLPLDPTPIILSLYDDLV